MEWGEPPSASGYQLRLLVPLTSASGYSRWPLSIQLGTSSIPIKRRLTGAIWRNSGTPTDNPESNSCPITIRALLIVTLSICSAVLE